MAPNPVCERCHIEWKQRLVTPYRVICPVPIVGPKPHPSLQITFGFKTGDIRGTSETCSGRRPVQLRQAAVICQVFHYVHMYCLIPCGDIRVSEILQEDKQQIARGNAGAIQLVFCRLAKSFGLSFLSSLFMMIILPQIHAGTIRANSMFLHEQTSQM
jgi:hypothetical protein